MRLIDADSILNCKCKNNFNECDTCTGSELCELLNKAPTISLDEGVRLIWSAQIDDIIEKIKEFKHDCEDIPYEDCPSENGKGTCRTCTVDRIIKILEEAKA